ncbi:glycosyltransferase [Sphingobacterium oryzagri]|uniref:Glycosyltransferase n=1 Tax=Sphingobacterium oryzagri TaxID=3025669 RepID=A0ABY7WHL6_9SPHI|nr:glycosyltransferase [Sphingobacterium sp. KACC 22765]WDF68990.1 glycosyltransferase [Sphingobacterium sp. KACC 22765]
MKVLSVGTMVGLSNTCLHRHWALEKIADEIYVVNTRSEKTSFFYKIANYLFQKGIPIRLPDDCNANQEIRNIIDQSGKEAFDVLWIDKGITINPDTLAHVRRLSPKTKIVSYSPDNMALKHNQSQNYLKCVPLYDVHFTTKSYILEDLKKLGAVRVEFTTKHYEQTFHYERDLAKEEMDRLGGDVGFIGAWEKERCESILYLVNNGIKVKVYGDGKWNDYKNIENLEIKPGVYSEDYSKALQSFKISLCFLRKMNHDLQTSRTMEIPACGGFMLAERTIEHLELFEEGEEAEYFSSNEELLEKCRYYLINDDKRRSIAKGGKNRCATSGYSNEESIRRMLKIVLNEKV